jgi:hypothetical protein
VQELIREAYAANEKSRIEAQLIAGIDDLEADPAAEMTLADWECLRRDYQNGRASFRCKHDAERRTTLRSSVNPP